MANVWFLCDKCGKQSTYEDVCPVCGVKMSVENDEWKAEDDCVCEYECESEDIKGDEYAR